MNREIKFKRVFKNRNTVRSYEIYTRKFSQVIQADDIHIAAHLFYLENPNEEIITIENIEARNESLSSTPPVEEKACEHKNTRRIFETHECVDCGELINP